MANLLSELLEFQAQIPICSEQHCGKVWNEKIHIITIIPAWSPQPVGITHTNTPVKLMTKWHPTRNA